MKPCYAGVDLGGTNIAIGIVTHEGEVIGRVTYPTNPPRPAEAICDDIARGVREACRQAQVPVEALAWVGIGAPGMVDPELGLIHYTNNLDLTEAPIKDLLQERLHKAVYMDNDASAATLGEVVAGAAKGYRHAIMMTLGTGVGGGIVIDGKPYRGFRNMGGELGHNSLIFGGLHCTCGMDGCVEMYCSATALIRQTRQAMEQNPSSRMWALAEGDLKHVSGRTCFDAAKLGDEAARQVVDQYAQYVGYAISGYINIFVPEVLVIGGGVSRAGEQLLVPVQAYVNQHCYSRDQKPRTILRMAQLGNDAGIIGAAFLGKMNQ